MSFIDLYRELHADKIQQEFPPSSRVLIDTLIGEFNSARWIDSLVFSERDLVRLTGLKKTTLHEAKHFLTAREYIKCTPFKNKTRYVLGDKLKGWLNRPAGDRLPTTNRPLTDQLPTTFENSNIHARDKTEDFKTLDNQSVSQSRGRVCAFNWDVDAEERLTALWLENCGAGVTIELLSYLRFIVEKHGLTFAEELIREMAGALKGDRMTLNYLRGCYKRKLEGGEKNVRVGGRSRVNRPNVLAFAAGRTASDSGALKTGTGADDGKGRFDDDEPDCSWLYESGAGG